MEKEREDRRWPSETTEWQTFSRFFSFSFVQDSGLKILSNIFGPMKSARVRNSPMVASRVRRLGSVYQIVRKTAVIVPAIAAGCHSCFHPRKASTARTASLQPSMLSRTLLALSPSITFKAVVTGQVSTFTQIVSNFFRQYSLKKCYQAV